ncbi:hypothetical protein OM076_44540, partial [Solirubrobacter ginsenosidimutans]|nr:hypothetical protein [Solirubrobacter ginsenosidimutans]
MRPIPADSLGHAHGLLRAIDKRGRLRTDEFVTEFSLEELFPPDLENALGRMRHFISYARAAGLVKEDRGVVELTEVGRRYIRSGEPDAPFAIGPQQAEWLRRQLREKHMTDSIFHGLAIGISLLASTPPGTRVSTMDFGRSMAYLGRAGWDNENTLESQGERHLTLLKDMEMIDAEHRVTPTGDLVRGELTLPVHMSLPDIAAQLNPGGAEAVRAAAEKEWAEPEPEPEPEPVAEPEPEAEEDEDEDDGGYHTVADFGSVSPPKEDEAPRPPIVPRAAAYSGEETRELSSGDPLAGPSTSVAPPSAAGGDPLAAEQPVVYPPPIENTPSPTDAPTVVSSSAPSVAPPHPEARVAEPVALPVEAFVAPPSVSTPAEASVAEPAEASVAPPSAEESVAGPAEASVAPPSVSPPAEAQVAEPVAPPVAASPVAEPAESLAEASVAPPSVPPPAEARVAEPVAEPAVPSPSDGAAVPPPVSAPPADVAASAAPPSSAPPEIASPVPPPPSAAPPSVPAAAASDEPVEVAASAAAPAGASPEALAVSAEPEVAASAAPAGVAPEAGSAASPSPAPAEVP